jgi:hypothetical protein
MMYVVDGFCIFTGVSMITLAVAGISLLIVFFLYAKTETLRREGVQLKRQLSESNGEVHSLEGSVEALAFEQQVELRKRLTRVKSLGHPDVNHIKYTEALIDVLINVVVESAKGEMNTVEVFRKQLIKSSDISFNDFTNFISKQDDKVKTEWHKKTVQSYLVICQHLIDAINGEMGD